MTPIRSGTIPKQLATKTPVRDIVPGEVLVGMSSDGFSPSALENYGAEVVERFSLGTSTLSGSHEVVRLRISPERELREELAALSELPGVRYAVPNEVIRLVETPSTHLTPQRESESQTLHPQLWGLHNRENPGADISAAEAWQISRGSREDGPLIAVLDSGADYHHPDLAANIVKNHGEIPDDGIDNDGNGVIDDVFGYNAYDNTGDPLDRRGHGSHVTGTIAAAGESGQGVFGVNWQARILPIKIFNDQGETTIDTVLRGLEYARKRGAFITSNSWGGASFSPALYDAFAATPGLHVTASGNDGGDIGKLPSFPANFDLPDIITVGATDRFDQPAVFSNFGRTTVELFAPGHEILSTLPGGGHGFKSGTSMACPHVTGVAALIKTVFPNLTPQEVKDRLVYSSDPLPSVSGLSISGGRLNAFRALSEDRVPPAAPNDFVSSALGPRGAVFRWTGTGDDGWKNGPASGFEVRVLDSPLNARTWASATALTTPRADEIGTLHTAEFHQSPQRFARTLHAGLKVIDEAANRSPLVTSEVTLPAVPVVAEENFDLGAAGWSGEGRWKIVDDPTRGKVWSCQPAGPSSGAFSRLTSTDYDLKASQNSFLRFESRQDFDSNNLVYVDISADAGKTWKRLERLEDQGEWRKREYDISAYDGKKVRIQISSESIATRPGEGTMVDNFEILGD